MNCLIVYHIALRYITLQYIPIIGWTSRPARTSREPRARLRPRPKDDERMCLFSLYGCFIMWLFKDNERMSTSVYVATSSSAWRGGPARDICAEWSNYEMQGHTLLPSWAKDSDVFDLGVGLARNT